MKVIENITNKNVTSTKKAALYYKTEPFYTNVNQYVHTNNWEIYRAIELLTIHGYAVDLIDRGCHDWSPKASYDLFLGLGVGNSGKQFVRYANASQAKKKVLLSMGPQPDISNNLVLRRYKMFAERTGHVAPPMRTVGDVIGESFLEIINTADFVFNIGEKHTRSYDSFLKYGKPVLHFYPSVSPSVGFEPAWIQTRDPNSFLCFAGNGFICKGVDLVVEAFLSAPDKHLHICGPSSERAFFEYYGKHIEQASNITYHGFIEPGGRTFNELASICSYVVFHSAAEGCCTSVATAIKAGLVPIINSWTGIVIEDEGIKLSEEGDLIENIAHAIHVASSTNEREYRGLLDRTLEKSKLFSQESFTQSYSDALEVVMKSLDR